MSTSALDPVPPSALRDYDPTSPLRASGNLRRRQVVSRVVDVLARSSAGIAVAALVIVTFVVIDRGAGSITWNFLTKDGADAGITSGGIASSIVGTAVIVAVGTVIAAPIGILTALYLTEFATPGSRLGRVLTLALNLMQGLPTIVVGIFVFGLLVNHNGNSGLAGSIALSIVMLPLIARTSQEVLLRVPGSLREAGDALGVERWRTIVGVVLPTASGGILTGTILAVARAAGETAPLLVCDSIFSSEGTSANVGRALHNIPITIFNLTSSPDPTSISQAWGAALVLFGGILIANVGARVLLARSRRRTGI
jgi:phosphate transport system permease protein